MSYVNRGEIKGVFSFFIFVDYTVDGNMDWLITLQETKTHVVLAHIEACTSRPFPVQAGSFLYKQLK